MAVPPTLLSVRLRKRAAAACALACQYGVPQKALLRIGGRLSKSYKKAKHKRDQYKKLQKEVTGIWWKMPRKSRKNLHRV